MKLKMTGQTSETIQKPKTRFSVKFDAKCIEIFVEQDMEAMSIQQIQALAEQPIDAVQLMDLFENELGAEKVVDFNSFDGQCWPIDCERPFYELWKTLSSIVNAKLLSEMVDIF